MKNKNIWWLIYGVFVVLAIAFNGKEHPFISSGPLPAGKYISWMLFLFFTGYSYYCSARENLFRTIKTMAKLHWGRQIGLDLYLGLFLFITLIFFHQQSWLISMLWLIPVLAFANLATLLYVALHYDSMIQMLMG